MREVVDLLAEITGIPAPRVALPHALLLFLGRINDWLSTNLLHRQPLFPLEAALHARDSQPFSSAKAVEELGYSPRPARAVLEDSVAWFQSQLHKSSTPPKIG
jgi:dihydroflavonol-4-reductase